MGFENPNTWKQRMKDIRRNGGTMVLISAVFTNV